jgi:hypothetical protein
MRKGFFMSSINLRFKASSFGLLIPGLILNSISVLAAPPANPPKPCPAINTLDIVMVGNGSMGHKSLKYPDGAAWDISYTYSVNEGKQGWGVTSGDKPSISYVSQSGWSLYGVENSTGKQVWRSYCNYESFKPAKGDSYSPKTAAWKFSLFEQYIGDVAPEKGELKEVQESTEKAALQDTYETEKKVEAAEPAAPKQEEAAEPAAAAAPAPEADVYQADKTKEAE